MKHSVSPAEAGLRQPPPALVLQRGVPIDAVEGPPERPHTEAGEMSHSAADIDRLVDEPRPRREQGEDPLELMGLLGAESLRLRDGQP